MSSPIPQALWSTQIPLHITHPASPTTPFITSIPRFSYLALLVPRLSTFFNSPCSSFHFEDVQLRNLAVGLLVDLYQPSLPWRLTVNDGVGWDIADTFLNCVKEVSRNKYLNISSNGFLRPISALGCFIHHKLTLLGGFYPKWQRKSNHEDVERKHHSTVERGHR